MSVVRTLRSIYYILEVTVCTFFHQEAKKLQKMASVPVHICSPSKVFNCNQRCTRLLGFCTGTVHLWDRIGTVLYILVGTFLFTAGYSEFALPHTKPNSTYSKKYWWDDPTLGGKMADRSWCRPSFVSMGGWSRRRWKVVEARYIPDPLVDATFK